MEKERKTLEGWEAPCEAFDYGKLRREAEAECAAIKGRLEILNGQTFRETERELLRRQEVRMLTDIYYEQLHLARLFAAKVNQLAAK